MSEELNVGLFGIGLDRYWGQFEGLRARLEGYQGEIAQIIRGGATSIRLIDGGLVDNPRVSRHAGRLFAEERVDIIFLYVSTYALSSTVLPVLQAVSAPVVVLNVQPVAAIDYDSFNAMNDRGRMTGEWLAHCQACSVPEIANVLNRCGMTYKILTGYLGDERICREMGEWLEAARTMKLMRFNRLGVMGHYYGGMLDVYTDLTAQLAAFGGHVELLEVDELAGLRREVKREEVEERVAEFRRMFRVSPECEAAELDRAARTSVALDCLVERHNLGSLACYHEGAGGSEHEDVMSSIIIGNTLLTGRNVPVAGECEVKNAQAMKIMDAFGVGGSFSEFYAMDFNDDVILLGHDGPGHPRIAEGEMGLVPLPMYHGKPAHGLSIQMTVRHGEVTLLSVCEGAEGVFLLYAEGVCVPGPVLNIGNTNSRYRFDIPVRDFMGKWSVAGPSHHCAIGVGHLGGRIRKLAWLLKIPCKSVCGVEEEAK